MYNSEVSRLQEEVTNLERRLVRLEREHCEHVAALEFQVKAHRDDWEAERTEKTAAEIKVKELQCEVRLLTLKLREEHDNHCCESQHTLCPKMYKTSVQLPCPSDRLLHRGSSLFCDDSAMDGDQSKSRSRSAGDVKVLLEKTLQPEFSVNKLGEGRLTSRETKPPFEMFPPKITSESKTDRLKETKLLFEKFTKNINLGSERDGLTEHERKSSYDISNKYPKNVKLSSGSFDRRDTNPFDQVGTKLSRLESKVNAAMDSDILTSRRKPSHSELHISPISKSILPLKDELPPDLSGGSISIGFNNGLASVTTFCRSASSKSLPFPVEEVVAKQPEEWSLDSNSFLLRDSEISPRLANSVTTESRHTTSWSSSYYEEGIATQTREDIICPGCSKVFPPRLHLKFLDHFEDCQKCQH